MLEQLRATLPTLEAQRQTAPFSAGGPGGRPPAEFPREVADCASAAELSPRRIPVGDGAACFARRPDIRAAERELAAATARSASPPPISIPTVSTRRFGSARPPFRLASHSGSAFRFSIGPLISWSFANTASRPRPHRRQARPRPTAALARFRRHLARRALEETESALTRYARELERRRQPAARPRQAPRRPGSPGFATEAGRELPDRPRRRAPLSTIEAELARPKPSCRTISVSLFLALGGGWQT